MDYESCQIELDQIKAAIEVNDSRILTWLLSAPPVRFIAARILS